MRKVYMSFLGTSNYVPCNYVSSHFRMNAIRFVQEATVSWWCSDWQKQDQILVFVTDEAREKNWLDNGHRNNEGESTTCQGLESRMDLIDTSAKVRMIYIPSGKTEDEIWDIFSIVVSELEDDDELFLDITHAFRSLPLLATVIINYAKVVKNIQLRAIGYGAMEALGNPWDVGRMDMNERDVPIFDLLPFDQLLDWSTAIDRFIVSGNAAGIYSLTSKKVVLRKKEVRGPDQEADSLRELAKVLMTFSQTLSTCRGKNIVRDATLLNDAIHRVKEQQLVKPLTPLLDKLEMTISGFSNDEVRDGVAATKWCIEHNLIQQGFTLLQETMCTFIQQQVFGKNPGDIPKRDLVGMAVKIELDQKTFDEWSEEAQKHLETIEIIRGWLQHRKELLNCMRNLSANRNDLNHAGMNDSPMAADKFIGKLDEYIKIFESQVYWPEGVHND